MALVELIKKWNNQKILVVGEALIDKYLFGHADRISPDAPVPNIKIESTSVYLGGIGLVSQYIKSLGGIPYVYTIVGNDYEGDFFLKRIKELKIDASGILVEDNINTPQITRVKAMNQHVLRLETDYNTDISDSIIKKFHNIIETESPDIRSILILDYGTGGLFKDIFIQNLLIKLKDLYKSIPILVRPTKFNYYLYENVDLIKMNLQKALDTFSIECCNETSVSIVGKKILNSSKCKNVLLNYLESESYLFSRDFEKVEILRPILQQPVRSYVAVGSVIMATLGLSYASGISVLEAVKIALISAALTASLPPVEFYDLDKLGNYLLAKLNLI